MPRWRVLNEGVKDMSALIEFILAEGASRGVTFKQQG